MTLRIRDISLRDFRSYTNFSLEGLGELTIFVGHNASGKTNAVEALQLMTALSSFRNATAVELVRRGQPSGRISCSITDGSRELDVALAIEDGKRTYTLNGKKKQPKSLRGLLPSVVFTPDDLELVKGSDKHRRHELDVLGSQLNANYYQLVRDFEKVLHHKNRLLKDEVPIALIEATDVLFAKVADQLASYRIALFDRLMPHVTAHYADISGNHETLSAIYERMHVESGSNISGISNTSNANGMGNSRDRAIYPDTAHATEALRMDEIARHRTLVGPHLDKIRFLIDDMDASIYASQGQQRSIVLALKLAEAEVVEEIMDQLPILLLDDVMSELDENRRKALVKGMLQGKQTFITTANINYFDSQMLDHARVVELSSVNDGLSGCYH